MSAMSIYESTFAKSDKTDAILVVDGKKLHVNKALLSSHSDYFNTLFNADFKEKSMTEIPIEDVKFEDFSMVLSLVQHNPMELDQGRVQSLLELADRFLLPAAKRHLELFIGQTKIDKYEKLRLADKYKLKILLEHTLLLFNTKSDFNEILYYTRNCSDYTQAKLFQRFFSLFPYN